MSAPVDYLLVGHLTADITPDGRILGGTVAYAARTVAALGLRVGVLTSADPNDPLLDVLRPHVDALHVIPAAHTSTFENIYTAEGRKQMIRAVAAPLAPAHLPPGWGSIPLVHLGPLTGELDPKPWLQTFSASITLMTAQGLLRQWGDDGQVRFKRWYDPQALAALDWLVLSEEDIAAAPDLETAYKACKNLVITRAENGGTHYHTGVASRYQTPTITASHPTGAGDVFAAGLLASLYLFDQNTALALELAARLGATAVTRPGWEGAPTPAEAQAILKQAKGRLNES